MVVQAGRKLFVLAIGGHALAGLDPRCQPHQLKAIAQAVAEFLDDDVDLVITHGNGPQIGQLSLNNAPDSASGSVSRQSLDWVCALSQAAIGFGLAEAIDLAVGPGRRSVAILTRVEVDLHDPTLDAPEKPIGPILSESDKGQLEQDHQWRFRAESDGFRRIVPSPQPQGIVEIEAVSRLVREHYVVVCAGGGGIPVSHDTDGDSSRPVVAVVDKDLTSALLARRLKADRLILATDIDGLYENWRTDQARKLESARASELNPSAYEAGSMAPKVKAARDFLEAGGQVAIIGALADLPALLAGKAGTLIRPG